MSNYPFAFSAVIYNGYDADRGESKYVRNQGFGFADSFAQAAGILENYYGSELISIEKLELFEESDLILMPQSCINEFRRRETSTDYSDIFKPCNADGYLLCEMNQEASAN
jgi:hypothetical protein